MGELESGVADSAGCLGSESSIVVRIMLYSASASDNAVMDAIVNTANTIRTLRVLTIPSY